MNYVVHVALFLGVFHLFANGQSTKPVAQLPQVYLDTTWNLPTGGTTWAVHTSAQLSSALTNSVPGDVIVLDAGATYNGYFALPAKSNPSGGLSSQWRGQPLAARRIGVDFGFHSGMQPDPQSTG